MQGRAPPPLLNFTALWSNSFARLGRTNLKKDKFTNFKALFPALYILAYWPLSKLKKPWKGALVPKL